MLCEAKVLGWFSASMSLSIIPFEVPVLVQLLEPNWGLDPGSTIYQDCGLQEPSPVYKMELLTVCISGL